MNGFDSDAGGASQPGGREDEVDFDIVVIGLGPVGAVLAGLLALTGLKVCAVEQHDTVYALPRAAHIDHEIMRVLQALGVSDLIKPHVRVAPDYEFRSASGESLMRFERQGVHGVSGWPVSFNIYQPGIESVIRDRLAELENLVLRLGTRLEALSEDADGHMSVMVSSGGSRQRLRSRFVVGCDGAWSPVREQIGVTLDDYGFDEPWLVLDALVPDERAFPEMNLQLCDPARPTSFIHMGPGRLRWEFMLLPGETAEQMNTPQGVERLLERWRKMGTLEVERTAVYRFHGLVAKQWRKGRVLLAGDAAHQMPPFLGQGLCSGLRDAANLAWKLRIAVSDGDSRILDSYQREREPHVRAVIERAIEMGRIVCTLDVDAARARNDKMRANPLVTVASEFPPMGGLNLDTPDAGRLFPQIVSEDRGRLDDFLGVGAWLLHLDQPPVPAGMAYGRAIAVDSLPKSFAEPVTQWLAAHEATAVLVRPDRYVFGSGEAGTLARRWQEALLLNAREGCAA